MVIFINLLSFIAPTVWVVIAGALGFSAGAYGPKLLQRFKNDRFANPLNPSNAATIPKRRAPRRAANSRRTAPRPSASGAGRKRPPAR